MGTEDAHPSTSSYREQGNAEFRNKSYLKAAALYTRAIKEDPKCAALYSNRSAALLHIDKVTKALADADECIRLDPGWDKGHFRRGAALEAMGKLEEVSTGHLHTCAKAGIVRACMGFLQGAQAHACMVCLLHALQALESYHRALECSNGESKQVQEKVRNMQKLVRQQKAKNPLPPNGAENGAVPP